MVGGEGPEGLMHQTCVTITQLLWEPGEITATHGAGAVIMVTYSQQVGPWGCHQQLHHCHQHPRYAAPQQEGT